MWAAGKHVGRLLGAAKHVRKSRRLILLIPRANVVMPMGGHALRGHWRIPEGIGPGFHLQESRRRNTSFTKKTGHRCRDAPRRPSAPMSAHLQEMTPARIPDPEWAVTAKATKTDYLAACGSQGVQGGPCAQCVWQPVPRAPPPWSSGGQ